MMFSRVLVTGGAGFIASHLVDTLICAGVEVTVLDNLTTGFLTNVNKMARFCKGEASSPGDLSQAMSPQPDAIFHLAGDGRTKETQLGWLEPQANAQSNIMGTLNILEAAVSKEPFPKVVFSSSAAVYGNADVATVSEAHPLRPVSPYGVSKLAGEKYCQAYAYEYGLNVSIARLFNIYGPRQSRYVMHDLLRKLHVHPSRIEVLGDGQQIRDYCYVSDAVEALILLAQEGQAGAAYNISSGSPISIRELVELLLTTEGLSNHTEVSYTGSSWRGDIPRLEADTTALNRLGFIPEVPLVEGLKRLSRWMKALE